MSIENAISIAAILSDAQEYLRRKNPGKVNRLLNEAKKELFTSAWRDANTTLSFEDWFTSLCPPPEGYAAKDEPEI